MIIWWYFIGPLIHVWALTMVTTGLLHSMWFHSIKTRVNIGLGNDLSPVRRQAIT